MISKAVFFGAIAIFATFGTSVASAESATQTRIGEVEFRNFNGGSGSSPISAVPGFHEFFNPFNSALGTLQSVDVSWSMHSNANVMTGASGSGNFSFNGGGSFEINSVPYSGGGMGYGNGGPRSASIIGNSSLSDLKNFDISRNDFDPKIWQAFVGPNQFQASHANNFGITQSNIVSGEVDVSYTANVTYNYLASAIVPVEEVSAIPAVPEPQTYALMLGGIGALAFMRRRCKQS